MGAYVYQTVNLLNGRYYRGVHQCDPLTDGYRGTGKLILRALKKHGDNAFITGVLSEWSTNEDAYAEETRVVVTVDEDPMSYNLKPGGFGGDNSKYIDYTNRKKGEKPEGFGQRISQRQMGSNNHAFGKPSPRRGKKGISAETSEKMRLAKIGFVPWNKGMGHINRERIQCRGMTWCIDSTTGKRVWTEKAHG